MSFLRHYGQFAGMTEEEVNARLRAEADERKRLALERVEPLDLARTTWPGRPHAAIVSAITYTARRGLHTEVDRSAAALRAELGRRHGVDPSRIAVGAGIGQLLPDAVVSLAGPGDEVVTPWPSYGLYPVAARQAGAAAVPVPGFGVEPVLSAITPRTRVVCLCNPNDPTGELVTAPELRALLEALPERVVVLVDEALRDFVTDEEADATIALLDDHPRLLLFRTFSKAWGLAGLRCGYALGGAGSEDLLDRLRPALGVDDLAQTGCLEAVLHHGDLPARRRGAVVGHRERLTQDLAALGLEVVPSQASVLWVAGRPGLAAKLDRAAIRVWPGSTVGAPDHVRLTVPHRQGDLDRLLSALRRAG